MIYVGTSGWQYDDWRPVLYAGVAKARWLEHFATTLSTVEVNNTFYRLPTEQIFATWRSRTPDGFVFSVKASRTITHERRLAGATDVVTALIERASALGPKLGAILYQCPPSLRRDDALLTDFLAALPSHPRATMEFRHVSWMDDEVLQILSAHDVALCIADSEKAPAPVSRTASWGYFRLHGGPDYSLYDSVQAAHWVDAVAEVAGACTGPVFVYFDNDVEGNAVIDASKMRESLKERGLPVAEPEPAAEQTLPTAPDERA